MQHKFKYAQNSSLSCFHQSTILWESTELCGEGVKTFGGKVAVMLYIKFAGPALALQSCSYIGLVTVKAIKSGSIYRRIAMSVAPTAKSFLCNVKCFTAKPLF